MRGRGNRERVTESAGDQRVFHECDKVRMKPCALYSCYKQCVCGGGLTQGKSNWRDRGLESRTIAFKRAISLKRVRGDADLEAESERQDADLKAGEPTVFSMSFPLLLASGLRLNLLPTMTNKLELLHFPS